MSIVVDASLAVKWLVAEQDSDLAHNFLLQRYEAMHAPDLLLTEVGGALVRDANARRSSKADALAGFAAFERALGGVHLHRVTPDLAGAAGMLAIQLGHPLKDCVYLALADRLGWPLATCDAVFRDRVGDPARVRLLAELA